MRISAVLAIGVAAIAISGCAPKPPAKPMPQEFMNKVIDSNFASIVSDACGYIRYNERYAEGMFKAELTKLGYKGYTRHDLDTFIKRYRKDEGVGRRLEKMIKDRNIDVRSERSWCKAGDREMARKTTIGRFLY